MDKLSFTVKKAVNPFMPTVAIRVQL